MKLLLVILGSIFSSYALAADIKIKTLKDAEDAKRFYPVNNNTLYMHDFNISFQDISKFATPDSKRLLRIPTKVLVEHYGFEKEEVFQVIDFENEKTFEYKIKNEVYAILFNLSENEKKTGNPGVSLILSDDPKIHLKLASEFKKRKKLTGFAYRGKERKLKAYSISVVPTKDIPKSGPLYSMGFFKAIKPVVMKESMIYGYKVLIFADKERELQNRYGFLLQKPDGTFHGFLRDSYVLDSDNQMRVYDLFENTKIMRMFDDSDDSGLACHYMALVEPKSLSMVDLSCFEQD